MSIFLTDKNPGAYQGELTCPFTMMIWNPTRFNYDMVDCKSKAIRYVEHITPYRIRYRCRKCGRTFQYDISGYHDVNPYGPYKKGRIWSSIERGLDSVRRMNMIAEYQRQSRLRGGNSKGGVQ